MEPGHFLRVQRRNGSLQYETNRYWDLDFPQAEERPAKGDARENIEPARDALIHAIVFRLEADVPVGCYRSEGSIAAVF